MANDLFSPSLMVALPRSPAYRKDGVIFVYSGDERYFGDYE